MSALYMSQFDGLPLVAEGDDAQNHFPSFAMENNNTPYLYSFMFDNDMYGRHAINDGDRHHQQQIDHPKDQYDNPRHALIIYESSAPLSITGATDDDLPKVDLHDDSMNPGNWISPEIRRITTVIPNHDGVTPNRKPRRTRTQPAASPDRRTQNNSTGFIRACSACNTTKTPLWRSGPCGPKSLCNACGIRQRKARKAMALATAHGGKTPVNDHVRDKPRKEKRSVGDAGGFDRSLPFKKRPCKLTTGSTTTATSDHPFDIDTAIGLSTPTVPAFHQGFQLDETDAAMLLMALSCGIVYT